MSASAAPTGAPGHAPVIRLLLVEDHAIVRAGLGALLNGVPGFEVVAAAGTVADGVDAAALLEPDVVLMDVRLPDGTGVDACREIRSARPQTRVLMLTSYADDDAVLTSLLAGAAGYLLKEADAARLVEAIKLVAAGGVLFDPSVSESMLTWLQRRAVPVTSDIVRQPLPGAAPEPPAGADAELTADERRILGRLAAGATNRQIAAALHFSEHTVKHYVSRLMRKLQVERRVEAAVIASRFLPPPGD